MKKFLFIALLGLIILLGIGAGLFRLSKSRSFQVFGDITARVNTTEKVIAITFDDAPSPHSDEVLKILAEKNIKATFYVIGQAGEKYPQELKNIIEQGHEVGNHSYSHQRFLLKSYGFVEMELKKTNEIIKAAGYTGVITFRPPFGKKLFVLPWYLNQHNIQTVMCDVEPDTYVSGDAAAITSMTLDQTKPGSIILLHPFCEGVCEADREALPKIIDGLKGKGYRFVTVSELLKYQER